MPYKKSGGGDSGGLKLPALSLGGLDLAKAVFEIGKSGRKRDLPNATLVYGIAAAILAGVSLFFLFTGLWVTAILILLPMAGLLGFSLYFLRITK